MDNENTLKLFRFADLVALGIFNNRMTAKRWVERGDFPAPIRLGENSIAWRKAEVKAWLEQRERVGAA